MAADFRRDEYRCDGEPVARVFFFARVGAYSSLALIPERYITPGCVVQNARTGDETTWGELVAGATVFLPYTERSAFDAVEVTK